MEDKPPPQPKCAHTSRQRYAVGERIIEITRKNRIGTIIVAHEPEEVSNAEWEYSILWETAVQLPPLKVKQSEIVQISEAS